MMQLFLTEIIKNFFKRNETLFYRSSDSTNSDYFSILSSYNTSKNVLTCQNLQQQKK